MGCGESRQTFSAVFAGAFAIYARLTELTHTSKAVKTGDSYQIRVSGGV
jgi:hypothetical protein